MLFKEEQPRETENQDDFEVEKFKNFLDENEYSADQIREAYLRLVGVSEESEVSPEVDIILGRMSEMVENKFPLNRFAEIIEDKQNFEDAPILFFQYVDSLKISDKEKDVLRSVVDGRRSGEVNCLVGGEIFAEFKVRAKDAEKNRLAIEVTAALKKIIERIPKNVNYEFTFSE